MVLVYTTGVWDTLHFGHLQLLENAKALGDKLIVGVQEDSSVENQKGKLPIIPTHERVAMLKALRCVDGAIVYHDLDQRPNLEMLKPHIMVQGEDWLTSGDRTEIVSYLQEHTIRLVQFPYTKGISSTLIRKKLSENN